MLDRFGSINRRVLIRVESCFSSVFALANSSAFARDGIRAANAVKAGINSRLVIFRILRY